MAVHVPLSYEAVAEARQVLLSTKNLLSPSDGEPVVAPTLDLVLGCYYMTYRDADAPAEEPEAPAYGSANDVRVAYQLGHVRLHDAIRLRIDGSLITTTIGRVLFNEVVPEQLTFQNHTMDKRALRELVTDVHRECGADETVHFVDAVKDIGFRYATQSGLTIAISDITVPKVKPKLMAEADRRIDEMEEQYQMGLVTDDEKYQAAINIWTETTNEMQDALHDSLEPTGSLAMMSNSGAKGNIAQIRQMGAIRGLMSDPTGRIIDLPIRSSFRGGAVSPRILHLNARRAQGSGRHRAAHGGLGLPHAPHDRCRTGRRRAAGVLRRGRRADPRHAPPYPRRGRPAGLARGAPQRPLGGRVCGPPRDRGGLGRGGRGDHIRDRARDRRIWSRGGARPLGAHLRDEAWHLPTLLWPLAGHRPAGRGGRGHWHHRRSVDR